MSTAASFLVDLLLLTDFCFNTFKRCEYDHEIFKKCVPSQNRKQFIQQSTVTGLSWGVFITAKVEDGQGSIVQTVFVHFSDQQKDEYLKSLLVLTVPLLDWLHSTELIERGYLVAGDQPVWMTEFQWKILKSHYKIWSAF